MVEGIAPPGYGPGVGTHPLVGRMCAYGLYALSCRCTFRPTEGQVKSGAMQCKAPPRLVHLSLSPSHATQTDRAGGADRAGTALLSSPCVAHRMDTSTSDTDGREAAHAPRADPPVDIANQQRSSTCDAFLRKPPACAPSPLTPLRLQWPTRPSPYVQVPRR